MRLTSNCPECGDRISVPDVELADRARCRCGYERPLRRDSIDGPALRACPWCATGELFVRKDFPQRLGMGIIVAGFAISTVFYYYYMPIWAMAVLLGSAVLDGVLFRLVPDMLTCYRCESELRDVPDDPDGRFPPFDLAVGERYRQERLRIEELRRRRAAPAE